MWFSHVPLVGSLEVILCQSSANLPPNIKGQFKAGYEYALVDFTRSVSKGMFAWKDMNQELLPSEVMTRLCMNLDCRASLHHSPEGNIY